MTVKLHAQLMGLVVFLCSAVGLAFGYAAIHLIGPVLIHREWPQVIVGITLFLVGGSGIISGTVCGLFSWQKVPARCGQCGGAAFQAKEGYKPRSYLYRCAKCGAEIRVTA